MTDKEKSQSEPSSQIVINQVSSKSDLSEARDEAIKLVPTIPIILTILGACKIYVHYKIYNIPIFNYLEIQEIIFLFLNDLLLYAATANIAYIIYDVVVREDFYGVDESFFKISKLPNWLNIIFGLLKALRPALLIIYPTLLVQKIDGYWGVALLVIVIYNAFNLSLSLSKKSFAYMKSHFTKYIYFVNRFYVFFFLFVTQWTYTSIVLDLYASKYGKPQSEYSGSVITTDTRTINIDGNNVLVGMTKGYFYIFNTKDSCTSIVPTTQVKDFYLKKVSKASGKF